MSSLEALRSQDRQARRLAQTEFRRPLVLEAGAGTGKTTTLVARVLAWCLGPGWEAKAAAEGESRSPATPEKIAAAVLQGVVAITFTEAAAAEMAEGVGKRLAEVAAGATPIGLLPEALPAAPAPVERARALLGALDHLAVRTIHSFCRSLLSRYPLEAGLHPQLTVDADGFHLDRAVHEAVERAVRRLYREEPSAEDVGSLPDLLVLAGRGLGPSAVAEAVTRLAQEGISPDDLALDPLGPEPITAFRRRLEGSLTTFTAAAVPLGDVGGRSKIPAEVLDAAVTTTSRLEAWQEATPEALQLFVEEVRELWPENLQKRLADWSRGSFNQGETAAVGEAAGAVADSSLALRSLLQHLLSLDPALLQAARRTVGPLLATVKADLRRHGVLTFADLLSEARRLVTEVPAVRRQVRAGMDQLLVDEFQDTDPVQCALVAALGLGGEEKERPGLFLVGDPKQSIYGWRSADLRAYDDFLGQVKEIGGEVYVLAENFRSVPAILEEVQRVVEPVMHEEAGRQPRFQPLFPCERLAGEAGFRRGGSRPVERWVSWHPNSLQRSRGSTLAHEAVEVEAKALAADLRRLHDEEGVPWGSVAVLLRSAGQLDDYLEELRRAGIPFAVGRTKQYYRRREIIEAAALVRTVLDPGDQLALVTLLRSPMVGVPDAALLPLWQGGLARLMTDPDSAAVGRLARTVAQDLKGLSPEEAPGLDRVAGWPQALEAAAQHLGILRRLHREEPAAVFVDALRSLFLQEVLESARYLGRYRLANLQHFFRQLLDSMEEGRDLPAVLRLLRRSVAAGEDAEEGQPGREGQDAVQVLTIHGAKGLGFPHVYLVQAHKASQRGRVDPTAAGHVEGRFEYRLLGFPTLGNDLLEEERRAVAEAEQVRLLYVALTRAKERLVLAGDWSRGGSKAAAGTLLGLVEETLSAPEALEAAFTGEGTGAASLEEGDARWLLAATVRAAEKPEEAPEEPEAGRLAEDVALLRQDRARARERQERKWSGAASAQAHEKLEEALEAEMGETPPVPVPEKVPEATTSGDPSARRIALATGSLVHRALEELDLAALENGGGEAALEAQIGDLPGYLEAGWQLTEDEEEQAVEAAAGLLKDLEGSALLERLAEIAPGILARELPVLLPPPGESGPVGYVSGLVDLLYRDPADGTVVVADFKTDDVAHEEALQRRTAAYARQGQVYVRALRQAFRLPRDPRFELWFLRGDRVVVAGPS